MSAKVFIGVLSGFALAARISAQEVVIVREQAPKIPKAEAVAIGEPGPPSVPVVKAEFHVEKAIAVQPIKPPRSEAQSNSTRSGPSVQIAKQEPIPAKAASADVRKAPKSAVPVAIVKPKAPEIATKRTVASPATSSPVEMPASSTTRSIKLPGATAFTKLAEGFDFPIGKPDAQGYYKARGFQLRSHLGEDWDGVGGGDTDLGDPVYCVGEGVVVFARDCHMGWGNVVIVRHAFREGDTIKSVDSFYAHLQKILVHRGEAVRRGQQIAAIGNAHGLYDAHLHFELRKNIEIGMSRDKFAKDTTNYYSPTAFIMSHRRLQGGGRNYRIALNTFTHDAKIPWDRLRNYSRARTGGGSGESARALKKALAARSVNTN